MHRAPRSRAAVAAGAAALLALRWADFVEAALGGAALPLLDRQAALDACRDLARLPHPVRVRAAGAARARFVQARLLQPPPLAAAAAVRLARRARRTGPPRVGLI